MGMFIGKTRLPQRARILASMLSKSVFSLSKPLTTMTLGNPNEVAYSQTCSVPTSIPLLASMVTIAKSTTRSAQSASLMKSRYPGVSMMLSFLSSHSVWVMEAWIEILRFCSS
ncbi:MAG: hypothetical protein BWY82_01369 [Verrucomicrobia bacterium ADurb.Bin474]|nr:MAG: hypothetical protein BWY82_01369 [Verrucomicrobia bacterium ADurb.Bin474]